MKDDYLIKRIRAGDENAAEELIRGYYPQIMRFCRWQCGNRELAEDLAQETFFRVFRSLDQYRKKGHFKAWLYSIAKSVCIDELRKRRVEREPGQDIADIGDEGNGIRQVEDEEEIRQLLSLLPEEQREALILHYMEGFTFREMGEILGIPGRTAQSRVNLALKNLRQKGERI